MQINNVSNLCELHTSVWTQWLSKTLWLCLILFVIFSSSHLIAQNRPNILWINADDLGRELSCYGHPLVRTPHIDSLAMEGIRFTNAYSNSPVCSSSRSSLITGMYPTTVNSQDHRTLNPTHLPDGIKPITSYFREAGYFICNGSGRDMAKEGKRDYNFLPDIHYEATDWNQRTEGQPFFAQVQIKYPHRPFITDEENPVDPNKVILPACYPDHPLLRADWALYLASVQKCDEIVGKILHRLEAEGLADNTLVFFFGDHGRPHLRDKQFLYEGGLQIPLIVRWPNQLKAGKTNSRLVSLVDVAATSLHLAGLKADYPLHGQVFLGKNAKKRSYVFGFRQRAGDAPDAIRSITDGRYKLIWNQQAERPWMQLSSYKRSEYPAFTLYRMLHQKGELAAPYNQIMADRRPTFEFYDLKKDPMEFQNQAHNSSYATPFSRLKSTLMKNVAKYDKNIIPESDETIQKAKEGSAEYARKKMRQAGLPEIISDEALWAYWRKRLLGESPNPTEKE